VLDYLGAAHDQINQDRERVPARGRKLLYGYMFLSHDAPPSLVDPLVAIA